jgi:DNA-binding NtrC family response regulator
MAKILLIEDDAAVQRFLSLVLKKLNHEAVPTDDGAQAVELAKDETIELILTDLTLPGSLSGMPMLRKLRSVRPACPIVVVSGFPTAENMQECEALGISDFLTKPFEIGFVVSIVKRFLPEPTSNPDSRK